MQPDISLLALNFALTGSREGYGPFLGVDLQRGFEPGSTGLAMGLAGLAIPARVAEIRTGTGHANGGLGGTMTAYGAGAAVGPALAGHIAQRLGFDDTAFPALAGIAGAGLALRIVGGCLVGMHPLSDRREDAGESLGTSASGPA